MVWICLIAAILIWNCLCNLEIGLIMAQCEKARVKTCLADAKYDDTMGVIDDIDQACPTISDLEQCMNPLLPGCATDLEFLASEGILFEALRYVCGTRKGQFKKHAVCLNTSYEKLGAQKCVKDALDTLKKSDQQNGCKFFDDTQRCIYNSAGCCGNEAADLMNGLMTHVFSSLREITSCSETDVWGDAVCSGGTRIQIGGGLLVTIGLFTVIRYILQ